MANRTVTVKRGSSKKAGSTAKKGSTAAAAKKGSTAKAVTSKASNRRSSEDLAKLADPIAKMRKGGSNWDAVQEKHGVNAIVARKILAAAGYNNKGEKEEISKITGSGKSLATKVAKQRREGVAFYTLAIATGKSESDLKSLLEEHGFKAEASGRTYKAGEGAGGR